MKQSKCNWFDFLVIFLLVVIIASAVFAFIWSGKQDVVEDGVDVTVRYVVEFQDIREEVADGISKEDLVYLRNSDGTVIEAGVVVGIQTEVCLYQSQKLVPNEGTGEGYHQVESEKAGRVNVLLTIEVPSILASDSRYYVSNVQLFAGKEVEILTRHFTGTGYCISLTEKE